MSVFFGIAYFIVGLAQLFAVQDWFINYLNWGSFTSFVGALFLTYIPLLGSFVGVIGAHEYWGWTWLASILLFFWYVPVFIAIALFSKNK